MFRCFTCGRPAFLIRGCCDTCDPRAHREFHESMTALNEASADYRAETGLYPLSDWYAFERWCRRKRKDLEAL